MAASFSTTPSPFTSSSLPNSDFSIVVALDFGTARSGFAYALKGRPDTVITEQNWGTGEGGVEGSHGKTRTCLLLDDALNLVAFGDEAITMYIQRRGKTAVQLVEMFNTIRHPLCLVLLICLFLFLSVCVFSLCVISEQRTVDG